MISVVSLVSGKWQVVSVVSVVSLVSGKWLPLTARQRRRCEKEKEKRDLLSCWKHVS